VAWLWRVWSGFGACFLVVYRHVWAMTFISELALWAPGEQSFSALAEAADLKVQPRSDVGLTTSRTHSWIARGKTEVIHTERCAKLTRDPALLTKLAKDRRATVRGAVVRNTATPYSLVSTIRLKDKSYDVQRVADDVMKRRIIQMSADEAVALLEDGVTSRTIDLVCGHKDLEDRHVQALADLKLQVFNKWDNVSTVTVAGVLSHREDLSRFSEETLMCLAVRGQWTMAARAMARRRGDVAGLIDEMIARDELSPAPCVFVAKMPRLDPVVATQLYDLATRHRYEEVISQLAANRSVDWRMLLGEKVRRTTVAALGRGLADEFKDEPAVWKLASTLCDGPMTVGEVLDVLRVTHADAAKGALGR